MAQRKAVTKAQLSRWPKATKQDKSEILDAICGVTGWHRDHARKVIRQLLACPDPAPRKPREPVTTYPGEAVTLLEQCWSLAGAMSGKRLKVALPGLLDNLARHGHLDQISPGIIEQVLAMSPATIDRRLAPARAGMLPTRGISHTRPGSLLKTEPHWV